MVGDNNYTFLGYYIFKILVSDLRQARGFLHQYNDHHDITGILLNVTLNTINHNHKPSFGKYY